VKEKSNTRGEYQVTLGGNDMESKVIEDESHIGQVLERLKTWDEVLLMK